MDRKTRIEENEKLFREVNERVQQMQETFQSEPDPEWVCECGDETCFEKVTVPLDEYHEARSNRDWSLIKPGHEQLEAEHIVERREGYYYVVEKERL